MFGKILWIITASLPLFLISSVLFLKDPLVFPDEPVFLDMAQNLLSEGLPSAHIIGNIIPEVDLMGFGYPPLYFLTLGVWVKIFGSSIESVRILSLTLAFFSLAVFFLISKAILVKNLSAFAATLFLSLNIYFLRSARLGRMEILVLFLLLITFLLLLISERKKSLKTLLTAGTVSGLAFLTHPLGIMVPIISGLGALVIFTGLKRKILSFAVSLLPAAIFLSLWLLYLRNNFNSLINTFTTQFGDKTGKITFIFILFETNFLWRILFTGYLLVILLFIFHLKKHFSKAKLLLFIALMTTTLFAIIGKENYYFVYPQPFLMLALVIVIRDFNKAVFLGVTIIFINLYLQTIANTDIDYVTHAPTPLWQAYKYDYHELTKDIMQILPQNQKTTIYLNSAPDPYFDLKENPNFTIIEGTILPVKDDEYKKLLDKTDYIIFTWIPKQFLADYINQYKEEIAVVGRPEGYQVYVVKLLPFDKRL